MKRYKRVLYVLERKINIKASNVHFKLPVSFFMVISVVEHGQCINEKIIMHIAVFIVHLFIISTSRSSIKLFVSINSPELMYIIKAIGSTISFAGKPNTNAIRITPSSPIRFSCSTRKMRRESISR